VDGETEGGTPRPVRKRPARKRMQSDISGMHSPDHQDRTDSSRGSQTIGRDSKVRARRAQRAQRMARPPNKTVCGRGGLQARLKKKGLHRLSWARSKAKGLLRLS
jgi:hypothetical protein